MNAYHEPGFWEEAYQREYNRLHETARTHALEEFNKYAGNIVTEWKNAPADWYGNIVLSICQLFQTVYSNQEGAKEALWKFAGELLGANVQHLSLDHELRLLYFTADELLQTRADWPVVRREHSIWWLHAWRRFINEKDPGFQEATKPHLNVSPPALTGLPPGADPENISDPFLQETYKKAIVQNRRQILYYNEQYNLRKLEPGFKTNAVNYLVQLYSIQPVATAEIKDLLTTYLPESSDADTILDIIQTKTRNGNH